MTLLRVCSIFFSKLTGAPGQLPALDGLRAIAIILVLLRHAAVSFADMANDDSSLGYWWLGNVLLNGWAGVDLFFVLSGFLICHHLLNRYSGEISLKFIGRYYLKRVFRTFPVYYAGIFICALGLAPFYEVPALDLNRSILHHVIFMQDYYGADILVPLWSLATEEKFYLLAPLLLLFLKRNSLGNKFVMLLCVFVLAMMPLIFRLSLIAKVEIQNYADFFWTIRAPFHMALDGILLGACVAILYHALKDCNYKVSTVVSNSVFLLGALMVVPLFMIEDWMAGGSWYVTCWVLMLFPLCFAMVIFGCTHSTGLNKSFLASRTLLFFSKLSYSIYVVHYALIPLVGWLYVGFVGEVNYSFVSYLVVYVIITILGSVLMHLLVERPFLAIKNRI